MNWKMSKLLPRPRMSRRAPMENSFRPLLEALETRQLLSTSVLTYHNDLGRTGQNLTETALTPDNVYAGSFGKLFAYPVVGQVYAQPLYMPGVTLPDGTSHDIVYLPTTHHYLSPFDAHHPTPQPTLDPH